jgi:transcriptional regulator with XRE-family HTH domain
LLEEDSCLLELHVLAGASRIEGVASISDRVGDLGGYLREQREHARLSLRQLAQLAGVSNPYLSQVERGLRNPSAEVLQQIARGLQISAEALYVRAGILDSDQKRPDVEAAVHADPDLSDRQKRVLLDIYSAFRAENARAAAEALAETETDAVKPAPRRRAARGTGSRAADGTTPEQKPARRPRRATRTAAADENGVAGGAVPAAAPASATRRTRSAGTRSAANARSTASTTTPSRRTRRDAGAATAGDADLNPVPLTSPEDD